MTEVWPIKGLCDHCGAPYRAINHCLYCGKERWDELTPEINKMVVIETLYQSGVISKEEAWAMSFLDFKEDGT